MTEYIKFSDTVYATGWIPVSDTWTYASVSTLNVPAGALTKYSAYGKVKFTQHGVVKFGYIYPTSDTLLTFYAGSDYVIEDTATYPITNIYYSNVASPIGFPNSFNLTGPAWTTTGAAFTNQPANNISRFSISERKLYIFGEYTCHATSGGTGIFIATFVTGQYPNYVAETSGNCHNFNNQSGGSWNNVTIHNVIRLAKDDATTIAGNGEIFTFTWLGEI